MIDTVRKEKIPVVFSESTISDKPARQVAKETGARYGGVLYVDSLSDAERAGADLPEAARGDGRDDRQGVRQVTCSADTVTTRSAAERQRCRRASLSVRGVTVTYPNGNTALERRQRSSSGPARSAAWSASTARASRRCSRRSWASLQPSRRRGAHLPACPRARRSGATSSPTCRRRGRRLELPRAGRGRGDDGPLRPHGLPAHRLGRATARKVDEALERVGMTDFRKRQIGELSGGQRKRVFLARALAQEGAVDPARRAVHRRRRQDRDRDRRAAARAEGAGPRDAGLDPQSRQRAGLLRPGGAGQPHGAGRRPDRDDLHPGQPRARVRRRAAPLPPRGQRRCTTTTTAAASPC